jgi:hypothetical protein
VDPRWSAAFLAQLPDETAYLPIFRHAAAMQSARELLFSAGKPDAIRMRTLSVSLPQQRAAADGIPLRPVKDSRVPWHADRLHPSSTLGNADACRRRA